MAEALTIYFPEDGDLEEELSQDENQLRPENTQTTKILVQRIITSKLYGTNLPILYSKVFLMLLMRVQRLDFIDANHETFAFNKCG